MPATRSERLALSESPTKTASERVLTFLDNLPQQEGSRPKGKTYGSHGRRHTRRAESNASVSPQKRPFVSGPVAASSSRPSKRRRLEDDSDTEDDNLDELIPGPSKSTGDHPHPYVLVPHLSLASPPKSRASRKEGRPKPKFAATSSVRKRPYVQVPSLSQPSAPKQSQDHHVQETASFMEGRQRAYVLVPPSQSASAPVSRAAAMSASAPVSTATNLSQVRKQPYVLVPPRQSQQTHLSEDDRVNKDSGRSAGPQRPFVLLPPRRPATAPVKKTVSKPSALQSVSATSKLPPRPKKPYVLVPPRMERHFTRKAVGRKQSIGSSFKYKQRVTRPGKRRPQVPAPRPRYKRRAPSPPVGKGCLEVLVPRLDPRVKAQYVKFSELCEGAASL